MKTPIEVPDATEQPLAYRDALLALVGERDPLAIMAETPGRVSSLLAGRDAAELAAPPAAGEWPAGTILGHLVDVEIVFGFRWRLALTEDRPSYPGYDEKRWSELPRPPAERLIATFDVLRGYNLTLLRGSLAYWERVGVHGEQGPETVDVMVRKIAGHDLAHLDQLARAVGA
jgi:DinB superfamily